MIARSYLYVPGDASDRLDRAHQRGADAVIADLEDGVAETAKPVAIEAVRAWLSERAEDGVQRWVRINAGERGFADLRAVFGPGLFGICVPKVCGPAEVASVVDGVRSCARESQPVAVMAIIETARGLRNLDAIAAVPGLSVLQLGELDLAADLGMTPGPDELELLPARAAVVAAAAAAGLMPPVAPVSPDFSDLDRFARTTAALKRLGFAGRAVIHPAQLTAVHEAFTPSQREIDAAVDTLSRYQAALTGGSGVAVDAHGAMIDEAVARSCRRILEYTR
ncbi:HpcH/HpaI aldolase/citrate lyase family protein [Jatrophihabitans lederbergiae]|uniref:CoA ester lyase n=1 Tax=Jatrophihabitans lederbergiae TaxID=3075547 RepID=A0ABU2JCA0_9ACTN|nr:CoA ester lyase [Jatrophihabitans sp. DSM 44399]MDT0262617.1 CoA ester lyase [Jatrophihabitans sp. DSM 44399]